MSIPEILPRLKKILLAPPVEENFRCGCLGNWGCEPISFELNGSG
jgi:hypothetical protein